MTQAKKKPPAKAKASSVPPSRAHARAKRVESVAPPVQIETRFDPAGAAVRFVAIDDLAGYEKNSRTHAPEQIARLSRLIERLGWTNPILAAANVIVAGHGRLEAAKAIYARGGEIRLPSGLGLPAGTVPVLDCTGWSEAQIREAVISDNSIGLDAGWNHDILRLELDALKADDFDLDLLGFKPGALDLIMKGADADETSGEGDGEPALDEPEAPTVIHCPKCAHEFSVLIEKPAKPKRKKAA